jgi:exodeoxyribonuclease VII large subunit
MQDNTHSAQRSVVTVSQLNRQARVTIEQRFNQVWVSGELSNFARPRSGHWYFTLKDDKAQVRCAMFANRNRGVQMQPSDGQQVLIRGKVSLYEGRGDFQIIVEQMEPAGEGALRQAFDALKIKLAAEGLFATEHKQPLPLQPESAVVVSSVSGAALHDVLAVWRRRYPRLRVTLIPTAVQGAEAEPQILDALARAEQLAPDVILLTRGGGSLEDLWCFNSESVARAIFALKTPVVAAIGHEIDVTIADFVADVRAPTPSAAAEIMVPNANDLLENVTATFRQLRNLMHYNLRQQNLQLRNTALQLVSPKTHIQQNWQRLDDNRRRLSTTAEQTLLKNSNRITNAHIRLQALGPSRRLALAQQQLNGLQQKLRARWQQNLEQHQSTLANLARMLEGVSPLPTLARGYAIVRTAKGEVVESTDALNVGDEVTAQLAKGAITANVINIGSATTVQSVDSGDDDESTP